MYNSILYNTFSDKRFKSQSIEATSLLQRKDKLVELQIKCLEKELEMHEIKKRTAILEEKKMLLEIEILKKKLNDS